ncbi:phosphopantetheine binding protein [Nonomuraea polychroma]|uniref:Phosphopantetheine binding protein n=1 Tax=Nonomuraea polychroma TaxID=46176 RepID=A0A438LX83_9ACTN|nr:acyl carrier protein [Nonomuraea polychroma]RVX38109.1 phosphopantetheine binding protein [Nonomuraea polychroma]
MIKERLAALVAESSDGAITAEEAMAATVPLTALGLTSIAQLRLVDAIEAEFGVAVDLTEEGLALLDDLDVMSRHLAAR